MTTPQHSAEKVNPNLTGTPETLLGILQARAIDSRLPHPVLGDKHAEPILARLDYDFTKLGISTSKAALLALRAVYLDRWVAAFLRQARRGREPVTVLHLAAGLDTRALRLQGDLRQQQQREGEGEGEGGAGEGPEVLWVDADLPDVVAVRRRLGIPEPDAAGGGMRYELRATDVTEENWLARLGVPRDRRTFVLFEGLSMYLTPEQGRSLVESLTSYFVAPGNQMAFDCIGWWAVATQKLEPIVRNTNSSFRWAIDEPREMEQWHEGLKMREVIWPADNPGKARLPMLLDWGLWMMSCVPFFRKVAQLPLFEW